MSNRTAAGSTLQRHLALFAATLALVMALDRTSLAQENEVEPLYFDQTPAGMGSQVLPPGASGLASTRPWINGPFVTLRAFGGYTGHANIHGTSGSVSSSWTGGAVDIFTPINPRLTVGVGIGGGERTYDFSGPSGLIPGGASPWEEIRDIRVGAFARYKFDDHWEINASIDETAAGETDSNFGDSLSTGGGIGFNYTFSKNLKLGLQLQVQSRPGANVYFLPVPTVDMVLPLDPQERLRFVVGGADIGSVRGGFVFAATKKLSLSLGLAAVGLGGEFRLDRHGPVPDGIGRASSFPLVVGVDWHPRRYFSISAFAGADVFGTMQVLDHSGNQIGKQNFGPAPTIGINAKLTF